MTGTYTPQHRVYATPPHVNVSHFSFVYLSGEDHPLVLSPSLCLSLPLPLCFTQSLMMLWFVFSGWQAAVWSAGPIVAS